MRREATGRIFRIGWDRPSGRLAAASSTGEILVWSDGDARPVTFKAHRADANSIDFSPDGNKAVSAGDDGVLRLWDTATWRPKWLTRAVIRGARPEILTHTGWHALDSQRRLVSKTPPSSAWRRAVEIAQDAAAQPGGPVCVAAESGLEIWDMESDTRAATENIAAPFEVAAVAGGCSVLKDGRATLYRQGHPPVELAHEVAVQSGGELLTLVGSEVTLFDPRQARIPRSLGTFGVGLGVTAAAPLGKALAVGFRDGNIELRQQGERVPISFQDTPASEVTRLEAGPKGLLAAGFADGSFGVWSSDSGERLERGAVHGAVRHLALDGDFLIVASEVGAVTSMDLSVFTADYCELLREVWSDVPVLWNDQAAVLASPEPASPCRLPSR
jgi:WD40 repeat protein